MDPDQTALEEQSDLGPHCTETLKEWWERSGSVVECLTRERGAAGSSLTSVTALCH